MPESPRPTPHGEELPPEEGIRSDHAGSSAGPAGVAPGGEAVRRADEVIADEELDEDAEGRRPAG